MISTSKSFSMFKCGARRRSDVCFCCCNPWDLTPTPFSLSLLSSSFILPSSVSLHLCPLFFFPPSSSFLTPSIPPDTPFSRQWSISQAWTMTGLVEKGLGPRSTPLSKWKCRNLSQRNLGWQEYGLYKLHQPACIEQHILLLSVWSLVTSFC